MMFRTSIPMHSILSALLLAPCMLRAEATGDLKALVQSAMNRFAGSQDTVRNYTLRVHQNKKEFDETGALRKEETTVGIRQPENGVAVLRILERNGRKLNASEEAKQQAKVQKLLARGPEGQRKQEAAEFSWMREVPHAFTFTLKGEESLSGRQAWVLHCEPREGFRPKSTRAKALQKVRGTLWIDKSDGELVKVDVETFDAVDIGLGFIGQIDKGTTFEMRRTRLPEGIWVTTAHHAKFGARILMVKNVSREIRTTLSDFRAPAQVAGLPRQSGTD